MSRRRSRISLGRRSDEVIGMSDEKTVLSALAIAAFRRQEDGSFTPLAGLPEWFRRVARNGTFPFLGHILEEAGQFWNARKPGRRDWGPCADVDEAGTEFHYSVTAVAVGDQQYLLFQLDTASDRI